MSTVTNGKFLAGVAVGAAAFYAWQHMQQRKAARKSS